MGKVIFFGGEEGKSERPELELLAGVGEHLGGEITLLLESAWQSFGPGRP